MQQKDKSVVDLLKILDKKEDKKLLYNDDVLNFIGFYNLKSGKDRVSIELLFKLYRKWSDNAIGKSSFTERLRDIFKSIVHSGQRYVYLNETSLNLSDILYKQIKNTMIITKGDLSKYNTFLLQLQLMPGKHFFEWYVFFYMYNTWLKKNKYKSSMNKNKFKNLMKLHFSTKNVRNNTLVFGINEDLKRTYLTTQRYAAVRKWAQDNVY